MSFDATAEILHEPLLAFRYGQLMADPRDGLSVFGPYDADEPSHPHSLTYGAVGHPEGLRKLRAWSRAMNSPATDAPGDNTRLWTPFPGFEAAFASTWSADPSWQHEVPPTLLLENSRRADAAARAYEVTNLYLEGIATTRKLDEQLAVLVCVVPDEVYAHCRPESFVVNPTGERLSARQRRSRQAGQLELFDTFDSEQYQLSHDFRRQLKARAMEHGIPIQLVRESTLELQPVDVKGARRLTPLSDRMWNLSTALYYKGGGKPWRLSSAREGVCYVGVAFRRADGKHGDRTACCAAQMFLNTGDGIVFLGQYGPWWSPNSKQFQLTRDAARELLAGALATYSELHGKPLREVFLHSRSNISRDEFAGYRDACGAETEVVGIRVRTERQGPRLFRNGKMPVLRGTFWRTDARTGYLFASGFKERLGTYDGWEIPAPLRIDVQHGSADVVDVARDILALTKLNYNRCSLGISQPVTVHYSDAVGEILVSNPTVSHRDPRFRFYI